MAADWAGAQGAFDSNLRATATDSLIASAKPLGRLTNILGAAVSVALIGGVGVWGYKLLIRDVSGIPVVRAIEGEMRIAPTDPGGEQADYQGLAVNTVAAEGSAEKPADRLILAPRPVDLADEDTPMSAPKPLQVTVPTPAQSKPVSEPDIPEATIAAAQSSAIEALVAELTNGVEPLNADRPETVAPVETALSTVTPEPEETQSQEMAPATSEQPEIADVVLDAPGVKRSLRPRNRPANANLENVVQVAAVDTVSEPLDPNSIPAGTRMVQLGAFDSEEVARSEWGRLSGRFEDYLEDKQSVIQRASSGGRVFYRLRAVGFDDLSDARRFCSALVAENADCIPVVAR